MKCIAIASTTGARCRNEAEPGSLFCDVRSHNESSALCPEGRELLEAQGAPPGGAGPGVDPPPSPAPGPDPEPVEALAPEPIPSDPSYGEISRPDGLGAIPPGGQVPIFPGPEAEPAAQAEGEGAGVDPELFREFLDGGAAAELEDGSGEPAAATPGRRELWTSSRARALVCPPMNRRLEKDGKELLTPDEQEMWGEAVAELVNQKLPALDPSNPWTALMITAGITLGPRYAPDLARTVVARVKGTPLPPRPAPGPETHQEAPRTPDDDDPDVIPAWGAGEGIEA